MGDSKNIFDQFMIEKDPKYTTRPEFHALLQVEHIEFVNDNNEFIRPKNYLYYQSAPKRSSSLPILVSKPRSFKTPWPSNKYIYQFSGSIDDIETTISYLNDDMLKRIQEIGKRYSFIITQPKYTYSILTDLAILEIKSSNGRMKATLGVNRTTVAVALNIEDYGKQNRTSVVPETVSYSLKTLVELIVREIEQMKIEESRKSSLMVGKIPLADKSKSQILEYAGLPKPVGGKTRKQKHRSRKVKKTRKQ